MTYDGYNYRLVTLTEEYVRNFQGVYNKGIQIAVWSTLSGMEIRRYKNKGLKEIQMFPHSCNFLEFS